MNHSSSDIIGLFQDLSSPGSRDPYKSLVSELQEGLSLYWQHAGTILDGSGISLAAISSDFLSLALNFFSALFLYSYFRAEIPKDRRVLYVAVNQCLRGMVTGCDNILDHEYKKTLDTDLPEQSHKFRSIIDIMVSDRIVFNLMADYCVQNGLSMDLAKQGSKASLTALSRSGIQEASEESGVSIRLTPEKVISEIHHYKTGILFQCPWAIPSILELQTNQEIRSMKQGLYEIGIGCQILDDIVDLVKDVTDRRHNYVASLVHHGKDARAQKRLLGISKTNSPADFFLKYPKVLTDAYANALIFLDSGLSRLFRKDHFFMKIPAKNFLVKRIGVADILNQSGALLA